MTHEHEICQDMLLTMTTFRGLDPLTIPHPYDFTPLSDKSAQCCQAWSMYASDIVSFWLFIENFSLKQRPPQLQRQWWMWTPESGVSHIVSVFADPREVSDEIAYQIVNKYIEYRTYAREK